MNIELFDAATWYLAMTLSERLQSGKAPAEPLGDATTIVSRRLSSWQSRQPFEVDELWTQHPALLGLANEEFLHMLAEPPSKVRFRFAEMPDWLMVFREASWDSSAESVEPAPAAAFTRIAEPLVRFGIQRMENGIAGLIEKFQGAPFGTEIIDQFRPGIIAQLAPMLVRTMALELNVARLEGSLVGTTSEERFESFVESLGNPETALKIFAEYPVLARQVTEGVVRSVNRNLEALERLCSDWEELQSTLLFGQQPGRLLRLTSTSGDQHRGGRAVLFAEFESGARIVYKPRSLAVDLHFQRLLEWVNEQGAAQPFRILKVIDRGEYGWVEFVSTQSCRSAAEVCRFYQRQGAYLALFYALETTDLHHENLLAAGEHPVFIDLEALFHPRFDGPREADAAALAENELTHSVLRAGLLPVRLWAHDDAEGVDLSGLSTEGEQMTPFPVPRLEGAGTDQMHLVTKRVLMRLGGHFPTMDGVRLDLTDYSDSLVEGFTQMYRLLVCNRDKLLEKGGPLDRFSADEIRAILIPTHTYAILLAESFHPDVLRDALDRDRLFACLWTAVDKHPDLERLMPSQLRDLSSGDVPIFSSKPESRHLWSSSKEEFTNYLEEPPMATVRSRLLGMSEEDLRRQLWVIRATLATLSKETDRQHLSRYTPVEVQGTVTAARLIGAAKKAGDWLDTQARRGADDAAWIGLTLGRDRRWSLTPAGVDLYDGLPGIVLFLAELGELTGEERYARLAERAIRCLLRIVEKNAAVISIGGFNGWGGLAYTFSRLAALWRREDLWREAEKAAERIAGLIERDEVLDIIGGAAGSIGALLGLYQSGQCTSVLNVATECGEHLLRRSRPAGAGIAWPAAFGARKPLTGFSHGAAGIAWALQQLADVTGEQRFFEATAGALAYERGLFDPEHRNWPDLRDQQVGGGDFGMAWCHGAPGIGLARLSSLPDDDSVARMEIQTALEATTGAGTGHGHSLCHGDLGNLDLLIEASRRPRWAAWRSKTERFAAAVLTDIEENGWRCGLALGVQSPGLMTGVAGIGYQLLRLADPERVASVLVFGHPGCGTSMRSFRANNPLITFEQ